MVRPPRMSICPPDRSHNHRVLIGFMVLLLLGIASPGLCDEYEAGEIQVELAPGVPVGAINARYGTTTLDSLPPLYLLELPEGSGEDEILEQLLDDPDIVEGEYAWENETPEGTRQMVVSAVGGTIGDYLDQHLVERLHLREIQEHTRGDGILVAVIDTGVLASHPALEGAIAAGGYDFVDNDDDPTDSANGLDDDDDGLVDEGAGHGTMVAGIIHLVAPGARIVPIRILDDEGQGSTFGVAKAIRHAVEQGADVINLSLGLTNSAFVIRHEIELADSLSIPMAAAAGNLGAENPQYFPASDSRVLSVAALDSSDVKADFSNWHEHVAVSAPGVGVYAPYYDGEYAIGAGTSFSVPFITGQCALILALNPALTIEEVYDCVTMGVVDIYEIPENEPYEEELGSGRFDGLETWIHTPAAAGLPDPASAGLALHLFPNPGGGGEVVFLRPIGFSLGIDLQATVYDARGRRVRTLVPDASRPGGLLRWDGLDEIGRRAAMGTYFVRVCERVRSGRNVTGRLVILPGR